MDVAMTALIHQLYILAPSVLGTPVAHRIPSGRADGSEQDSSRLTEATRKMLEPTIKMLGPTLKAYGRSLNPTSYGRSFSPTSSAVESSLTVEAPAVPAPAPKRMVRARRASAACASCDGPVFIVGKRVLACEECLRFASRGERAAEMLIRSNRRKLYMGDIHGRESYDGQAAGDGVRCGVLVVVRSDEEGE